MLHEVFSYKNGKAIPNNSIGVDCRVVWSDVYQEFYVLNHNGETIRKSTDGDGIINFVIDYSNGQMVDTDLGQNDWQDGHPLDFGDN